MTGRTPVWIRALLAFAIASPLSAQPADQARDTALAGMHGYLAWCAPCHGVDGRGKGRSARNLPGRPPRDFTRGLFEHRSTVDRVRPEDVARTILQGVPGTEMPAFRGLLGEEEALALAQVVLSFSPRNQEEPAGEPLEIPEETPDGEESRARGRTLFIEDCSGCHGEDGRGKGERSGSLKDAWGRPVQPRDLVYAPLETGEGARALYTILAAGMEGVPMPPEGLFLEPDQIWDLVHYVRSLRRQRSAMWQFLHGDPLDPTHRR